MRHLLLQLPDSTSAPRRTQREGSLHTSHSTSAPEPGEQIISGFPGEYPKQRLRLGHFVPLLAVVAVTFLCLICPAFSNDVATAIAVTSAIADLIAKRSTSHSYGEEGRLATRSGVKRITMQFRPGRRSTRSPGSWKLVSTAAEAKDRGGRPSRLPSPLSRRGAGV
jgi:hypothetical protein